MSHQTSPTHVSCYCGNYSASVRIVSTSESTIAKAPCHCNSCRHWSGGLYVYRLPISGAPSGLDLLKEYTFSSLSKKYFCPECGSHIFGETVQLGGWCVNPGVLDVDELQPAVEIVGHEFVEDTGDGGFTTWLAKWEGKALPLWRGEERKSELLPSGWPGTKEESRRDDADKLWAGCHCGGVSFYLTRPNEASHQPRRAPFPESMVPEDKTANPEGVAWWLNADGTKYFASLCTCESCSKATGFDMQAWAFVPECNIFQPDGGPLDYNAGTLKKVNSKSIPGVYRYFCSDCGATVFWGAEFRDGVVDISVGLLKGKGVRVEDWLEWGRKVSYVQESVNKPLIRELGEYFTVTDWPKN